MRAIVFDLDGTLIDPTEGIGAAYTAAAAAIGRSDHLSSIPLRAMIGPPIQQVFSSQWGCTAEEQALAVTAFRTYFGETGITQYVICDGVPKMLDELAQLQLAIATVKPRPFAARIVSACGWEHRFEPVGGSELSGERQTKAEVLEWVLQRLQLPPDHCAMVGDRADDIDAARRLGMVAVGAAWGFGDIDELRDAGADLVASTPLDCAQYFLDK